MRKTSKFVLLVIVFMIFVQYSTGFAYADAVPPEETAEISDGEAGEYEEINYSLNYLGYDSEDTIYRTDYIEVSDRAGVNAKVAILYTETEMIGEYKNDV